MTRQSTPAVFSIRFFCGAPNSSLTRRATLAFVSQPNKITVAKGETIEFVNNKAFPHNVVFDEDAVPDGVDVDSLSSYDLLNAPGESHSATFDVAGTYEYYCEPHQGAGMAGKVVVN